MVNRSAACSVDSLSKQFSASSVNDRYDPRIASAARRESMLQEEMRQRMQLTEIVRDRMIESGQMERLKTFMRRQLSASGWKVDMMNHCRAVIRENGKNIRVENLYEAVADPAKQKIPRAIKEEALKQIKHQTLQTMGKMHSNNMYHGN